MKRIGTTNRYRRSGFTLIEMLVAAAVAAFITAAAATMINGIANASTNAAEYRAAKSEGMASMQRITKRIRAARALGEVTPTSLMLWEEDMDGDDVIDDVELAKLEYVSGDKTIVRTTKDKSLLASLGLAALANDVGLNPLLDSSLFTSILGGSTTTETIAEGVEQLTFNGSPANTDARIINITFEKPMTDDKLVFRDAASPRASGDYLFVDEAKVLDEESGRWVRKEESRWTGYTDLKGETVTFPSK